MNAEFNKYLIKIMNLILILLFTFINMKFVSIIIWKRYNNFLHKVLEVSWSAKIAIYSKTGHYMKHNAKTDEPQKIKMDVQRMKALKLLLKRKRERMNEFRLNNIQNRVLSIHLATSPSRTTTMDHLKRGCKSNDHCRIPG